MDSKGGRGGRMKWDWNLQVYTLLCMEEEMATHSSILAWRVLWTEELGGLQHMGSQESDATEQLNLPTYTANII